jgi:hypothetical protein
MQWHFTWLTAIPCSSRFYNAYPINICNPDDLPASAKGFVYDVNALAFGETTKETCETPKILPTCFMKWSHMYGAEFAPRKYTLVYRVKQRSTPIRSL